MLRFLKKYNLLWWALGMFLFLSPMPAEAAQNITVGQSITITGHKAEEFYSFAFTPTVSGRYWIHSPNNIYFGIAPADRYHQVIEQNGERGLSSYLLAGRTYIFDFFVSPTDLDADDWQQLTVTLDMLYASDVAEPNSGNEQMEQEETRVHAEFEEFLIKDHYYVGEKLTMTIPVLTDSPDAVEVICTSSDGNVMKVTGSVECVLEACGPGTAEVGFSVGDDEVSFQVMVENRTIDVDCPYGEETWAAGWQAGYTVETVGTYYFTVYGAEYPAEWSFSCDSVSDFLIGEQREGNDYVAELYLEPGHVYRMSTRGGRVKDACVALKTQNILQQEQGLPEDSGVHPEQNGESVRLDPDILESGASEERELTLVFEEGTVIFEPALQALLLERLGDAAVEVLLESVEIGETTKEQQKTLKQLQADKIISANILHDGTEFHDFEGRLATLRIPFDVPDGAEYVVVYVAEDGRVQRMETICGDGYVQFVTTHFSTYAIVKEERVLELDKNLEPDGEWQEETKEDMAASDEGKQEPKFPVVPVVVAAVILAAAVAFAVFGKKKGKP